ncbi:MAG TPA: potassium transporter, partial [Gammaproteobacteria bacterium]|nr:potassium transporter [Gammaproteobacteria bacterium]
PSTAIDMVAVVFMLLSGVNFALHYIAIRSRSLRPYRVDAELTTYLGILSSVAAITVIYLIVSHTFAPAEAMLQGLFQVVSIGTTTGFTTTNYLAWPGFLPVLLLFTSFVGGCAGSTGGGMKVIRVILLFKQGMRELKRIIHPSAQLIVKTGRHAVPDRVIDAVWGFFATYVAVFSIMMLLLLATGLDQVTAFSAVAATINNLGPGLGEVGANYAGINDFSKLVLCFSMLLGRLEIFTLLVLFTPTFWSK